MNAITTADQLAPAASAQPGNVPLIQIVVTRNTRKRMSESGIAELAESIRRHGVLQPVLLRPHPSEEGKFDLIAGHRRVRAGQLAEIVEIPARIVIVNDLERLELQVIENLQREDLHPLEEAEGYEELLQAHKGEDGYGVEQLASKLGKSKAFIYARLKLCALGSDARKAFYDELLDASTALLLARIPVPALQQKALREVLNGGYASAAMPFRQAKEHIQGSYMLRLDQAKFKIQDETLVPAAGACGSCPKRTGANPDLFNDVGRADVCTDPECHAAKGKAHAERLIAAARESGKKVITGKEAKKIRPNQWNSSFEGYVKPDDQCWEVENGKTYRKLLGKDAPESVLLEDPHSGEIVELLPVAAAKQVLKDKGLVVSLATSSANAQQRANDERHKLAKKYRRELYLAIHGAVRSRLESGQALDIDDLQMFASVFFHRLWSNVQPIVAAAWDLDVKDKAALDATMTALSPNDAALMLMDIALATDTDLPTYSTITEPERLVAVAGRYGVDAKAIKRQIDSEAKAKKQSKVAAARKTAAKKAAPAKQEKRGAVKSATKKEKAPTAAPESPTPSTDSTAATTPAPTFPVGARVQVRDDAKGLAGQPLPHCGLIGTVKQLAWEERDGEQQERAQVQWESRNGRPIWFDAGHLQAAPVEEAAAAVAEAETASSVQIGDRVQVDVASRA